MSDVHAQFARGYVAGEKKFNPHDVSQMKINIIKDPDGPPLEIELGKLSKDAVLAAAAATEDVESPEDRAWEEFKQLAERGKGAIIEDDLESDDAPAAEAPRPVIASAAARAVTAMRHSAAAAASAPQMEVIRPSRQAEFAVPGFGRVQATFADIIVLDTAIILVADVDKSDTVFLPEPAADLDAPPLYFRISDTGEAFLVVPTEIRFEHAGFLYCVLLKIETQ